MFRRLPTITGITAAAIILTGCTAQAPAPTPTHKANPNATACKSIQSATETMGDKLNDANIPKDAWADVQAEFDDAGLHARGDVKTRIEALVSNWPGVAVIVVYHNYDEFNSSIDSISRACNADGITVELRTFSQ